MRPLFSYVTEKKYPLFIIIASLVFVVLHLCLYEPHQRQTSDSLENLAGAYNIALYNTYGVDTLDDHPHPSTAREPLYPLIVGLVMKVRNIFANPRYDIRNKPSQDIINLRLQPTHAMNRLIAINVAFLYATIFLSGFFIYKMTRRFSFVFYTVMTLIFSAALAVGAQGFLTEILAAMLCMIISILLYYSKEAFNKNWKLRMGLAVSLSALVLVKALFLYFIPIIMTYLIILHWRGFSFFEKGFMKNFILFSSLIVVLAGAWMLRNFIDFGRFFISERKAQTLIVRANYDLISSKEYPYLYAIWTPGLSKYFLKKDSEQNWKRLVNLKGNDQIIIDSFEEDFHPFLKTKKMNLNGLYDQDVYRFLEKKYLTIILAHPWEHLKLTLAFLYRCFYIEDGSGLKYLGIPLTYEANADKRVDSFPLAVMANLPLWFGFFYILLMGIRRKDPAFLSLTLIPGFTVLAYSICAISHPRYLSINIPLLTVMFCLSLNDIWEKRKGNDSTRAGHFFFPLN